jgi:hypothetical protein
VRDCHGGRLSTILLPVASLDSKPGLIAVVVLSSRLARYISRMIDAPRSPPNTPIAPDAASGEEARIFHEIVQKHGALPEGVRPIEFRFGEVSAGEPAVWIVFVASDDLRSSKRKIADLRRVADEVRSKVLRSASQRRPYVEIATE